MKLRNVRRRQWARHERHYEALTRRAAPYTVTDEYGDYLGWPLVWSPASNRAMLRDAKRREAHHRHVWGRTARWVAHTCQWEPADLPIDAEGNTRPGFVCVHELENGNGPCGGNVFRIEDAIGMGSCIVHKGGPGW